MERPSSPLPTHLSMSQFVTFESTKRNLGKDSQPKIIDGSSIIHRGSSAPFSSRYTNNVGIISTFIQVCFCSFAMCNIECIYGHQQWMRHNKDTQSQGYGRMSSPVHAHGQQHPHIPQEVPFCQFRGPDPCWLRHEFYILNRLYKQQSILRQLGTKDTLGATHAGVGWVHQVRCSLESLWWLWRVDWRWGCAMSYQSRGVLEFPVETTRKRNQMASIYPTLDNYVLPILPISMHRYNYMLVLWKVYRLLSNMTKEKPAITCWCTERGQYSFRIKEWQEYNRPTSNQTTISSSGLEHSN